MNCEWCGDVIESLGGHINDCYVHQKFQKGGQEELLPERHETLKMGKAPGDWEFEEKQGWGHPVDYDPTYDLA